MIPRSEASLAGHIVAGRLLLEVLRLAWVVERCRDHLARSVSCVRLELHKVSTFLTQGVKWVAVALLPLARAARMLAVVLLSVGGALLLAFHYYSYGLPDHKYLIDYQPPMVTRVYAGDGRLLAEYGNQHRIFVPIGSIPQRLIEAFISAEDKNFYSHEGIDLLGVVRALAVNLGNLGAQRRPVGASTITQQVAKNFLLTDEVSLTRKIREIILARRLESSLSKDRILELYLNQIFLGFRAYGVASAALNYFDKSLDDLALGEMAFLAALPKGPNNYHPTRQSEAALGRRNWVLGRMLALGYINEEQAVQAQQAPLQVRGRDPTELVRANYFAGEVKQRLVELYSRAKVYDGGLSVRTSLDPRLQQLAHSALRSGLLAYDRRHGWRGPVRRLFVLGGWQQRLAEMQLPPGAEGWKLALVLDNTASQYALIGFAGGSAGIIRLQDMRWAKRWQPRQTTGASPLKVSDVLRRGDVILVQAIGGATSAGVVSLPRYALRQVPDVQGAVAVMDPRNGRVLALVGGLSYAGSNFNRATQAQRQSGSAFKPFVFLSAFQQGFTPSDLVMDEPISIILPSQEQPWIPRNYSDRFYGPTTLRAALEHSRNIVTVRLAQAVGMENIVGTAQRFGILDNMEPLLSGALGAQDTTLLRLTNAYAMLANGCRLVTPTLIDLVQDRYGRTIRRSEVRTCPQCADLTWQLDLQVAEIVGQRPSVADPRHCYQVISILEGAVQRGTGRRLRGLNLPMAGKTGTTNDNRDAWFIGFVPDLVVGVYVGFDQPRTLGKSETGSSLALPIFERFMVSALAGRQVRPFPIPMGVNLVLVNAATGQLADRQAGDTLWEAFLAGSELDGSPREILGQSLPDSSATAGIQGFASEQVPASGEPPPDPSSVEVRSGTTPSEREDSFDGFY